jgi:ketosteroid isomerase-like protein
MTHHTHPNEDLLRKGYEAFQKADLDTLRQLFDANIVFHTPGRSPISGDQKGVDEVLGFFGRLVQETGGTFKIEVHDILANDEHGVALFRATGKRKGKTLDQNTVNVFHVRNGKVTEAWGHPEDLYAADEFWS